MKCARAKCPRKANHAGFCYIHHQERKAKGLAGLTSPEPVREHIRQLRALGWDDLLIANYCGLDKFTVRMTRTRQKIRMMTARAILRVPLVDHGSVRLTADPVPIIRRIRALQANGWGNPDIAARTGLTVSSLSKITRGERRPSHATARVIREFYAKVGDREGPSRRVALVAKGRGFVPPIAWDDDTIDDPNAEPYGYETVDVDEVAVQRVVQGKAKPSSLSLAERYAAAKVMVNNGAAPSTAATRLGLNRRNVTELTERLAA